MRLGIDFGTTRTVVAQAIDGRFPLVTFETSDGALTDYVPGTVARVGDSLRYGWEAVAALRAGETSGAVRSIKRRAASLNPDELVDEIGLTAIDAVTGFLRHLHDMILGSSNATVGVAGEVIEAMIAVPAQATTRQRYLTIEAFGQAGFGVIGLLNEPSAAAIELAHRNTNIISPRSPKRYVVVYDLGGGTFDTAALSLEAREFRLLSSAGISQLGGDDFDSELLTLVAKELDLDLAQVSTERRSQLLEFCRDAKESLRPKARKILIELDEDSVVLPVSDYDEAVKPLVDRTLEPLRQIMASVADFGVDPEDARAFGGLYLVGGGVSLPSVQRALRAEFGRKVSLAPQPHASTAVGLAVAGDEDAEILVREATTRHFGVWRETDSGAAKRFDPLFRRGQRPEEGADAIVRERRYVPVHGIGHMRYLECSELDADGQPAGELTPWNDVIFPYRRELLEVDESLARALPTVLSREPSAVEIIERYAYGADGSITVTLVNETEGYSRIYALGRPTRQSETGPRAS